MKTKFSGILTLFLAFVVQVSFAQDKTVSGVVSDENGLPLPSATVAVKGTSNGTTTDFDGNYSISTNTGDVLTFSYVGYSTQEVTVGASNSINVTLEPDNALEEVIIQAYNRKASVETSNIASTTISSSTIESRPNANFAQTLQGQVAGLNIATGSGQPGANSNINLRGVGSINGNTEPLFIMDGVPVDEDNFRSLNPNDIESISVLKDAGATSIYGNRGANGVVLISTKRGNYDQGLKIKYSGATTFSSLQNQDYDLMNSREQLMLEKTYGSGYGATLSDTELLMRSQQVNTDWIDEFFGTALTNSHTLSISSGGKNVNSFTSIGYFNQGGILKDISNLKRFNFRNNTTGKSNNGKFNYGSSFTINYSENTEPTSVGTSGVNQNFILGALTGVPYVSPSAYVPGNGSTIIPSFSNSPLLLLDKKFSDTNQDDELKIIANINADYEIIKNVTLRTSLGMDFTDEHYLYARAPWSFNATYFAEDGNNTPGYSVRSVNRALNVNFNNSINYRNTFNDKHTIDVSLFTEYYKAHLKTLGYTQNGFDPKTYYPGDGSSFISDNSDNDNFVDVANADIKNAGLFSYFAYADYDYDKKYGLSATVRRDASYRFNDSNKWGTFWSVAGRWNISNEAFMDNVSFVNELKLRASYGSSGNQNVVTTAGLTAPFVGPDLTKNLYATGSTYGGQNGLVFSQLGNNDLKWETIWQGNIGLDFALFNTRLRGNVDFYQKITEDLFITTPISPSLNGGRTGLNANVGELENRGVDLSLKYDLFRNSDEGAFNMTLNFVGNYNKQEILDLGPGGDIDYTYRVGGVLGEIYAAPYVGVNPANGNLLFLNKEGNITEDIDETDQRATGLNIYPDYQGSFGFDMSYKNFFFTTQFNYVVGVDRYDFDYEGFLDPNSIGQFRHSRDILRAWTQPGDITDIPSLNATNLADDDLSDRFLRDADYLRLRFVQLGYNFPKSVLDKTFLSDLRIYASAENLVTFSKWRGLDAEAISSTSFLGYPTPKIIAFGVDFGF